MLASSGAPSGSPDRDGDDGGADARAGRDCSSGQGGTTATASASGTSSGSGGAGAAPQSGLRHSARVKRGQDAMDVESGGVGDVYQQQQQQRQHALLAQAGAGMQLSHQQQQRWGGSSVGGTGQGPAGGVRWAEVGPVTTATGAVDCGLGGPGLPLRTGLCTPGSQPSGPGGGAAVDRASCSWLPPPSSPEVPFLGTAACVPRGGPGPAPGELMHPMDTAPASLGPAGALADPWGLPLRQGPDASLGAAQPGSLLPTGSGNRATGVGAAWASSGLGGAMGATAGARGAGPTPLWADYPGLQGLHQVQPPRGPQGGPPAPSRPPGPSGLGVPSPQLDAMSALARMHEADVELESMLQELKASRAAGSGAAAGGGAGAAAGAGTSGGGTLSPGMLSLLSSGGQQSGWAASLDGLGSLGSLGSLLRSGEKSGVSTRAGALRNGKDP